MANYPVRRYAHPFDRPRRDLDPKENFGVHPSSDAIGGFYGIGWWSAFEDYRTGEIFRVQCRDGVYGGKDAHTDNHLEWMEKERRIIVERAIQENDGRLSPHEYNLSCNFIWDSDPKIPKELKRVCDPSIPDRFTTNCPE